MIICCLVINVKKVLNEAKRFAEENDMKLVYGAMVGGISKNKQFIAVRSKGSELSVGGIKWQYGLRIKC